MNLADYIKTELPKWPNWITVPLIKMNIFGPLVYGGAYRHILAHIDEGNPEKRLCDIVNFAIAHVPYYRNRYPGLQIRTRQEFEEKIGFIDKDEVMAHWDEFLVDGIDFSQCVTGTTGGTSGKPLKLILPKNRYAHSMAFWHKELQWFGWRYDTRGVIRNHHLPDGHDCMINPILKEYIFDAFRMSAPYARRVWKILRRHRVRYLHAYPSAAYQFLKLCHRQQLDVSFLRLCILTSEGVTGEQRHFIEQELHIPIYSSYGHSEKLIMAGNCPDSPYYHVEENYGYCELINPSGQVVTQPGETGELVGTTFINRYMPLIRYRTGDYSSYAPAPCPHHGPRYRYLNGVQGRREKSLIYRADGTTTSLTALNLHGDVYEHIDGLQYVQTKKGELTVRIIKNEKFTPADEALLLRHHQEAMGTDARIHLQYVDKLEYQPNGKFLPLISRLSE